jgi:hypothetical protein
VNACLFKEQTNSRLQCEDEKWTLRSIKQGKKQKTLNLVRFITVIATKYFSSMCVFDSKILNSLMCFTSDHYFPLPAQKTSRILQQFSMSQIKVNLKVWANFHTSIIQIPRSAFCISKNIPNASTMQSQMKKKSNYFRWVSPSYDFLYGLELNYLVILSTITNILPSNVMKYCRLLNVSVLSTTRWKLLPRPLERGNINQYMQNLDY